MAENIPLEPDPDNAGVGIGNCKINQAISLKWARGYGFIVLCE
jgi:hypothetical protein